MQTEFARAQMITQQIRAWDVLDERVLDAMRRTPREFFVPERYVGTRVRRHRHPAARRSAHARAENCRTSPAGAGRASRACARWWSASGTGFVPACLSAMGASVRAIEIHARARGGEPRSNLKRAGFGQVDVVTGDTFNLDLGKDYALIAVCGALPLYDDRFARALASGWEAVRRGRRPAAAGSPAGHANRREHLEQHRPVRDRRRRAGQRAAPRTVSVLETLDMIREISVEELKARRDRGENPLVLDVREDWELQLARIPDVVHVPMNQIPARLGRVFSAMRRRS